jgi:ABC-type uncharacterized transport system involved in gliding motility auxiliary subunit
MDIKKNMSKYYKFLLYLVIIVLVNLAGVNLFFRIDLTSNNLYSLSKASKKAVSTLNEPLTINVFFSKNLPAPYNNIERYLHDLIEEYSIHSNNRISYRFYDVSAKEGDLTGSAEENRKKAQDYGIYPVNVQTIDQDEAKVQRAYMGMVFIHGDIIENIPSITTTDGLEYKITSTIQKMNNKISALLSLTDKIKVKLIQSSSLEQIAPEIGLEGLKGLKSKIAEVVDEVNQKTYNQLEFVYIDPSFQTINEDELAPYQRFGLQWPELKKEDGTIIPVGKGIIALGIETGEKSFEKRLLTQKLNLTSQGFQEQFQVIEMEEIKAFIEGNVDNLINIHDEIGYLSSHGTMSLSASLPPQLQAMQPQQAGSLTKFNYLLSSNYSITQIDLKAEEIPDSIDNLIIAGAKENFSDWELFQIDQFLMKGKTIALFMESFNEIQPQRQQQMYQMQQPAYLPINTGLGKLLEHYGAKVKKSYVLDESCYVNRDQYSGETPIYFAPLIKNENINHKLDFMSNIKELIMIKISPVEIDSEKIKQNDLKSFNLIKSSARAWEMSGRINLNPMMMRPPMNDEERKVFPLAFIVEGRFPSYFADKSLPKKPEPKKEEQNAEEEDKKNAPEDTQPEVQESKIKSVKGILTKGQPGKIFLIGTTEILKDNVLDEAGNSPNALFLLNTIDYLNNKSDTAVMRSKNQRFNPLKDTKAFTRTFVKIINIGGLPALIILLGISVWFRRKARRKKIQSEFLKKKSSKGERS